MDNNIIGIFDSGVGGLTVFSKLVKLLPNENYIYYGDTKNIPYGSKTKDELIKLAKNIFDFYAQLNAKAVVMACNTTSATTYEALKNDYDFIIYPVIQVAAKCLAKENLTKLGILSTQATADSNAYKSEIKKHTANIEVFEQGCPGWVQIVENKTFDDPESKKLLEEHLGTMMVNMPEKIVLGCTHYPYLRNHLSAILKKDIFIDPAECFVEYISNDLKNKNLLCDKKNFEPKFIVSANPENFKESAKLFYELEKKPILV